MASLMEVRDMLALQGRMEAKQLSARLQTPQPLIDAMLERRAGRSGGRCDERSQAWSRNEVKRVRQL